MFSLRHLAAAKIPENICTPVPQVVKTTCYNVCTEVSGILSNLHKEYQELSYERIGIYSKRENLEHMSEDGRRKLDLQEWHSTYDVLVSEIDDRISTMEGDDEYLSKASINEWYYYFQYLFKNVVILSIYHEHHHDNIYAFCKGIILNWTMTPCPRKDEIPSDLSDVDNIFSEYINYINKYIREYEVNMCSYKTKMKKYMEYCGREYEIKNKLEQISTKIKFYDIVKNKTLPKYIYVPVVCRS